MHVCTEEIVNSAIRICARKGLQDASSEEWSRKLCKACLCYEKQRKGVSGVVSPCSVGELLWLVFFKSFLFNWKMKTSLRVPVYLYSPRKFCRLETMVWNNKINGFSSTVHWEKAFLAFKLEHFSFCDFWLNTVHCTEKWLRRHTWLPRAYSLEKK